MNTIKYSNRLVKFLCIRTGFRGLCRKTAYPFREEHVCWRKVSFSVLRHFRTTSQKLDLDGNPKVTRPKAQTTIDEEEIKRFSALAQLWWDEEGEFSALHTMNELRVPLIVNALIEQKQKTSAEKSHQFKAHHSPLKGFKILDVGSGGGILSEPLARLGAFVIGVDASVENIKTAQAHVIRNEHVASNIKYICATVEDLIESEERSFDCVIASEVVEHVLDTSMFIKACCKLVKPGGSMFLTTLNRTNLSYVLGVVAAERLLRLVEPGTHDWNKFISPQDLQYLLDQNGFSTRLVHGMMYNPITKRWSWTENTSINYAIHAVCTDEVLHDKHDK
ncbi:ubiquinone biosynthesis O-methyltransferase, mitochondrial [Patella vulgata]|uniref:ubiquinone biosynthesis O-methyltransferase, mitochondrial n=1 Tax=Patella vulgata TaxID=6465 RepID=UPI00218001EC|nr:ubiquinone biosynthesis O-methyltransferase, mitochondrial [Patella vulgata]